MIKILHIENNVVVSESSFHDMQSARVEWKRMASSLMSRLGDFFKQNTPDSGFREKQKKSIVSPNDIFCNWTNMFGPNWSLTLTENG